MTKTCTRCGATKPLGKFRRRTASPGGRGHWCLACCREYTRAWRMAHPGYQEEYNATAAGKLAMARAHERRRKLSPERKVCHQAVARAVRSGVLVKPTVCPRCSRLCFRRQMNAHHEDYSKPLAVLWVCLWCHRKLHAPR